jgi:hypothetical protein
MPPDRRLFLRDRRSTHCSGEGEDPAPPFPPDGGTRGTDASVAGRRARGHRRQQLAAGSPACTSTSPPLTKRGVATTVAGEARERTLRQRARPPRRDGGKRRAWRRLASPAPAPVGVPPHSLASCSSGVWRRNERGVDGVE